MESSGQARRGFRLGLPHCSPRFRSAAIAVGLDVRVFPGMVWGATIGAERTVAFCHLLRYTTHGMIKSFRHKGLARFFATGSTRGIDARHAAKLRRMLFALDAAEGPENLDAPGNRLHQLRGDRQGQWAMWVSGNWRLVFVFDSTDIEDVDLVDYH